MLSSLNSMVLFFIPSFLFLSYIQNVAILYKWFAPVKYKEIHTSGMLSAFVKYFWTYEHEQDDVEYTILPDACFDLVVDYEYNILQNIYLTGLWTEPIKLTVTKGTTLMAVRFKVLASEYLLKREIKTLLNGMTILPRAYWDIHLVRSFEFEKFVAELSILFTDTINQLSNLDNRKIKLTNLVYSENVISVKELSQQVGWSSRQINRYFNQQFGLSLKTLLNVVRCNATYPDIVAGRLYPDKAYTDQAHYIKEIKKYTANAPSQLQKNENDRFLQLSAIKSK